MKTRLLLLSLTVLAGLALPVYAQQPGADPALTQQAEPALVKMVPADAAGKPFTVAIALGSPPDDFRNEKGEIVGWRSTSCAPRPNRLGSAWSCVPPPSTR